MGIVAPGRRYLPLVTSCSYRRKFSGIPNDSTSYTRTMTGCKSPPGSSSAIPHELPGCVQQPNASRPWQTRLRAPIGGSDVAMQRTAHTILGQHDSGNGRQQPLERNEPRCRGDALVLEEVERHRVSKCERAGPRRGAAPPDALRIPADARARAPAFARRIRSSTRPAGWRAAHPVPATSSAVTVT